MVRLVFVHKKPVRNQGLYDAERMWSTVAELAVQATSTRHSSDDSFLTQGFLTKRPFIRSCASRIQSEMCFGTCRTSSNLVVFISRQLKTIPASVKQSWPSSVFPRAILRPSAPVPPQRVAGLSCSAAHPRLKRAVLNAFRLVFPDIADSEIDKLLKGDADH